jgi:hypothetical protein
MPGGYKTVEAMFPRFLGPDRGDLESRRWFNAAANGKIGEYWRRLGAPGISAFCILGSWADGNHWYEGDPVDGRLKPVWDWMAPVWSPRSCSLELWNRNVLPGARIVAPLHMFNDVPRVCDLLAELRVVDSKGTVRERLGSFLPRQPGYSRGVQSVTYTLPEEEGRYWIEAEMLTKSVGTTAPVVSRWEVFAMTPRVSDRLAAARCAVPKADKQLREALLQMGLTVSADGEAFDLLVTGTESWKAIQEKTPGALGDVAGAVSNGIPVVMLDVGPAYMGAAYPAKNNPPTRTTALTGKVPFIRGSSLSFRKLREGEIHVHPTDAGKRLWGEMHRKQMWLWNGARGGVIVPAVYMRLATKPPAKMVPLVQCGPSLRYKPVVRVGFDGTPVILSQLLTSDRLIRTEGSPGVYEFTYDPAAVQMVLNMLDEALGAVAR